MISTAGLTNAEIEKHIEDLIQAVAIRAAGGSPHAEVLEVENTARAEIGRALGLKRLPTWLDVADALSPLVIRLDPGKADELASRLAAMNLGRSTTGASAVECKEDANVARSRSEWVHTTSVAAARRAIEIAEGRHTGNGGRTVAADIFGAIQAIVELIAKERSP